MTLRGLWTVLAATLKTLLYYFDFFCRDFLEISEGTGGQPKKKSKWYSIIGFADVSKTDNESDRDAGGLDDVELRSMTSAERQTRYLSLVTNAPRRKHD